MRFVRFLRTTPCDLRCTSLRNWRLRLRAATHFHREHCIVYSSTYRRRALRSPLYAVALRQSVSSTPARSPANGRISRGQTTRSFIFLFLRFAARVLRLKTPPQPAPENVPPGCLLLMLLLLLCYYAADAAVGAALLATTPPAHCRCRPNQIIRAVAGGPHFAAHKRAHHTRVAPYTFI